MRTSESATAVPNPPNPMTTTGTDRLLVFLVDDGPLLGEGVVVVAGLERRARWPP